VVTCVYSSLPSPSDGDNSPVPIKPLSCQTETEEKKGPHRGTRGGKNKKKNTAVQSANVTAVDSNISEGNVGPAVSNIENEAVEEQAIPEPDANVTIADSNNGKGNVGPAVSNIEEEDSKEQLAAPSRGENDNVTSDISNNEETASGSKKRRNRHKPVLMTLKAYKFVMSRVPSYAHYVYTPLFFFIMSLFLTLPWSGTVNPTTPINYQPGLFLVSPLPPNAPTSLQNQVYNIYSPPIYSLPSLRTLTATPTCSPPPTSTSLTFERHQSRCAHI
jgi:hypothetical protein